MKLTLYQFAIQRIPINGQPKDRGTLYRLVNGMKVKAEGANDKGTPLYSLSALEAAHKAYRRVDEEEEELKGQISEQRLINLRKKNELAEKEREKLELTLANLKARLVEYEGVNQYLVLYKVLFKEVLKKLLLEEVPNKVPKMEQVEAREAGEGFYNQLVQSMLKISGLFKESNTPLEDRIRDILQNGSKSNAKGL